MSDGSTGRLRTTSDANKAFEQYDELRSKHTVLRAVVIAETAGEKFHILGHVGNPGEVAMLLYIASQALDAIPPHLRQMDNIEGDAVIDAAAAEEVGPPAGRGIRTLAAQWAVLEAMVFGDSSKEERRDHRRTFYAGAITVFEMMTQHLDRTTEDATEADLTLLCGLKDELQEFREQTLKEEDRQTYRPSAE